MQKGCSVLVVMIVTSIEGLMQNLLSAQSARTSSKRKT
jgi:hypothetical protein